MSSDASFPGCRSVSHTIADMEPRPPPAVDFVAGAFDSGRSFQAHTRFTKQRPAARRPGVWGPRSHTADPTTGPIMTPVLVAAESPPSAFARSFGSTESPM